MKENGDAKKTTKETLSNIQMVENVKTKKVEDLKSPLQFTAYGISEIETFIYLSGENKGFVDKLRRYCWKGIYVVFKLMIYFFAYLTQLRINESARTKEKILHLFLALVQ